ncbi:hypothetical protein BD413DRAFT_137515 [Trametes elegans]|nr:hypothetical protein BD413DRAFT_137515 [Trametes elegans]
MMAIQSGAIHSHPLAIDPRWTAPSGRKRLQSCTRASRPPPGLPAVGMFYVDASPTARPRRTFTFIGNRPHRSAHPRIDVRVMMVRASAPVTGSRVLRIRGEVNGPLSARRISLHAAQGLGLMRSCIIMGFAGARFQSQVLGCKYRRRPATLPTERTHRRPRTRIDRYSCSPSRK